VWSFPRNAEVASSVPRRMKRTAAWQILVVAYLTPCYLPNGWPAAGAAPALPSSSNLGQRAVVAGLPGSAQAIAGRRGGLRRHLRLRGGIGISGDDEDSEAEGGMQGPGPANDDDGEASGDEEAPNTRKGQPSRKRKRGAKQDPTSKRKHRGRRGGKHAKAARAKRLAKPMDEEVLGDIQSVAATLAEISAASPHAVEQALPTGDVDPVMHYIIPSQYDSLDDVKRITIFDERHEMLKVGSALVQRLHGTAHPSSWADAWFAHGLLHTPRTHALHWRHARARSSTLLARSPLSLYPSLN
jgi:hypothetical protein